MSSDVFCHSTSRKDVPRRDDSGLNQVGGPKVVSDLERTVSHPHDLTNLWRSLEPRYPLFLHHKIPSLIYPLFYSCNKDSIDFSEPIDSLNFHKRGQLKHVTPVSFLFGKGHSTRLQNERSEVRRRRLLRCVREVRQTLREGQGVL